MKLDERDREAIEFVKMQRDTQGCITILLVLFLVVYGILHLFGISDAQILAWLIEKGILLP